MTEKERPLHWDKQTEVLVPERNSGRYVRRGPTLQATPSLRLSLTVKSNDSFTLVFPTRDSVTFPTARYGFDMNRIAVLTIQRDVFCISTSCILRQPIQGGLTKQGYPEVMKLGLASTDRLIESLITHLFLCLSVLIW